MSQHQNTPNRKPVLKFIAAVVLVLIVAGAIAGVKTMEIRKLIAGGASYKQPPETVSTVVVKEDRWQGTLTAIGSIAAAQGVTITPDIPGTVREIAFESGAVVAKDALLVKLDTSSEAAQLRAIQAQVELAQINLNRMKTLREDNMVSQSELDSAVATLKQNQANADNIGATIAKKTIRAPFAGRLGIRMVNLGQYLDVGKPIVSLQSLAPVYVDFSLPQQELAKLKTGMKVRVKTDTYPGEEFEGLLTAINPDLDQGTRSIGLQATLANEKERLRPGMFVRAEVLLPVEQSVLVIPAPAVLSQPFGDSVYLVEESAPTNGGPTELVVRQQIIRAGRTRGNMMAVDSGLKAGQRVVSSGIFKLRTGMAVAENNNLVPPSGAEGSISDN